MNVAIVRGRLSSEPRVLELESGDVLVRYEVTVARPEGPPDTVPAAWIGPAGDQPPGLTAGDEVLVFGRVRRRFWRGPDALRSATEVVADSVLAADDRRRVNAVLRKAAAVVADA
ncbi:MAG: single-stranded DNA-binding protein [Acidimicrobiales bacterium]